MSELHLPSSLESSQRILVAGAGGGFDVYAGMPVYERLRCLGKQVFLSNLSFTLLESTDAAALTRALYVVEPSTSGPDVYFPERALSRFLSRSGEKVSIYTIAKLGVVPVRQAYAYLVQALRLDAIVLVDGGTDILLRGDEQNLGTPAEDMTSLAAVASLELPTRLVACVGFGVDTFHGVCHANWLENAAALNAEGALLGVTALLKSMPEVQLYLQAVAAAELEPLPQRSIVNASIASAIEGHFGDYHRGPKTRDSTLFINPLMSLVWLFDLSAVSRRNLYLGRLADTQTMWDVHCTIAEFHASIRHRALQNIPH